jgi:hypothetical protein
LEGFFRFFYGQQRQQPSSRRASSAVCDQLGDRFRDEGVLRSLGRRLHYIIPILGIFSSALLYFWIINRPHSDAASIVNWAVTLGPAVCSFGYVFYFLVNRPKRFRHDWLDGVLNGNNYNHKARRPIRHPLSKLRSGPDGS